MTFDERLQLLTRWEAAYKRLDAEIGVLLKITGGSTDSPIGEAAWRCFDLCTELTAELVGFTTDDLDWWIYENELGDAGALCGVDDGPMKPMRTLRDYTLFLQEANA